jgi:hypothetical protein
MILYKYVPRRKTYSSNVLRTIVVEHEEVPHPSDRVLVFVLGQLRSARTVGVHRTICRAVQDHAYEGIWTCLIP